ncbi:energy-coupling factor ABC transporter ATP-binding protein [Persephonella sp.]
MIEFDNVSFSYGGKNVLNNLSFKIEKKEKVVILGVNGSGKTTILKILNGLIFPKRGRFLFKGVEVTERKFKDKNFIRSFRKSNVLLFQNPDSMLFNPTVYDEVAFSLKQFFPENEVDERVKYWTNKLNITHLLNRSPFELSAGEKQKVCISALLSLEPEVLLLDEPTSYLDPKSTLWFIKLIESLEITVVSSTHNIEISDKLGSRSIVLSESGDIIYDGEISHFINNKDLLEEANLILPEKF